ncbi:tetratricopeptide repeat protein 29-like [Dendronephthya gigantea]|uniref:tetratricopeptide repeat protein 29-like n=1 Tax=Dendronephthya gigantea TaxID=151771 RepID=UPI00106D9299|nr:tetratricopeptide repeat protein 29-like [Dendronephthya gigantea]XP_028397487.1 tetratricopeptide repeat protein 29-like [Dendronephthya gigantea]
MASVARLPSLSGVGGHVTQQVLNQLPSPPKLGVMVTKKRSNTKGKRDLAKDENSTNAKIDTERYRNSYMHNLCLDMLKDGFHHSFCELFNLLKKEKEEQERLGPDSGLQDQPLVQDQPQKLEQMKVHLTEAEAAKRRGKMDAVYSCYLKLATYFEKHDDISFSNHFYKLCLEASIKVRGDGRRKEAEANFNMGVAFEKQGYYVKAMECFENFYSLTNGRLWKMEDSDRTLFSLACESLQSVYTTLSTKVKDLDSSESIDYLLKAYKVSKEGDNIQKRGDASYILGCAYLDNADPKTALLYYNEYLNLCQESDDLTGMGKAHRALAKSYEKQMDIDSAVKNLESFVELSEKSGDFREQQRACSAIGEMLNTLGKYEESSRYIEKAYKLTKKIQEEENKELVRTEYGIVIANLVMFGHSQAMNTTSPQYIDQLLNWKQTRKNVFAASVSIPRNFSLEKVVDYHGSDEDINIQQDSQQKRNENETGDDVIENEHTRAEITE